MERLHKIETVPEVVDTRRSKNEPNAGWSSGTSSGMDQARLHAAEMQKQREVFLIPERSKLLEESTPEWTNFVSSFNNDGRKAVVTDFDLTITVPLASGHYGIVAGWIEVADKIMKKGHPVKISTGGVIDRIVRAFQRVKAPKEFIDRLDISGEYGATRRGLATNGEVIVREDLKEYVGVGENILNTISKNISNNEYLRKFDLVSQIKIEKKQIGGNIYHKGLEKHLKRYFNEDIDIQTTIELVNKELNSIIANVLEDDKTKAFYQHDTGKTGIALLINNETTGKEVSKRTAIYDQLEQFKDVNRVIVFGDDDTDLEMKQGLEDIIASGDAALNSCVLVGVRQANSQSPKNSKIEQGSTVMVASPEKVVRLLQDLAEILPDLSQMKH